MSDIWAYCSTCERWFYAGSDAEREGTSARCPVCSRRAGRLADRSRQPA